MDKDFEEEDNQVFGQYGGEFSGIPPNFVSRDPQQITPSSPFSMQPPESTLDGSLDESLTPSPENWGHSGKVDFHKPHLSNCTKDTIQNAEYESGTGLLSEVRTSSGIQDIESATTHLHATNSFSTDSFHPGESVYSAVSREGQKKKWMGTLDGSRKRVKKERNSEIISGISQVQQETFDDSQNKDSDESYDSKDEDWGFAESSRINRPKSDLESLADESEDQDELQDDEGVAILCDPSQPFVDLGDHLRIPERIFNNLFDYQQVAVNWLWTLHKTRVGGILGDEMGLGKTVQIAGFLAALDFSAKFRNALIVCPATVMGQWKRELIRWWPKFNVALYHKSSSTGVPIQRLLNEMTNKGGILITSYETVRLNILELSRRKIQYVILDEGHKIRNPDADITIACKRLPTFHRIILSGSPIQNNLREIWSLFDFIYPGKLGTYPVFEENFEIPILAGRYANASEYQIQVAYQSAVVLRDLIGPYMLRRMKSEVKIDLKSKQEKVFLCHLSETQKEMYSAFQSSKEFDAITEGRMNLLYGIDHLRKICNHPDLLQVKMKEKAADYGLIERSGKLQVLVQMLQLLKEAKHRVLVFSQTIQMLDIIEMMVRFSGFTFLRLDGKTQIQSRLARIDQFNQDKDIFVFLLTTRVGGLGLNLTGADRVIIYDPDWNPSVDAQARERSWRIGQDKDVIIYRLITQGTIEEKIYHRQIFKQTLTNKILKDPRQTRLFHRKDLGNLFRYNEEAGVQSASAQIFGELESDLVISKPEEIQEKSESKSDACTTVNDVMVESNESVMIRKLFQDGSIGSILLHDRIEQSKEVGESLLQHQAKMQAKEAAMILKNSQKQCQSMAKQGPTWTGRRGEAGNPTLNTESASMTKPILGKDLLRLLKDKQKPGQEQGSQASADGASGSRRESKSVYRSGDSQSIAIELQRYFLKCGGHATTDTILSRFGQMIRPQDKLAFRSILKEIAALSEGVWTLKEEYSNPV